ncbi:MAG: TonB-dependent receptor [Woeseiaceae bacterium]|nr:TonB-dependent receptor [Gammaproteobacteria bacterium]NNK25672.1 TonB-dependent receptor [Woeseiaceae bacterium]
MKTMTLRTRAGQPAWQCLSAAAGAALLAIAVTPATAVAQDTRDAEDASDSIVEEIIVTSRRREETLQDVPIAVSAFSGDQLEDMGAVDITAVTHQSPNVHLEVSRATNTTLTAYIRGIGQQDPVAGWEGGVGIYLDDVYLARPQGTVFDVYDVERIEVLRGPQGTLYGRNTIGGAVRYVTKRLSDEQEFSARASLGTYGQADLVLKGSMPVSDTFRIGGTLAKFTRDGWGSYLETGEENADKDILAGRFSMEWEASDNVFLRLFADYSVDDSTSRQGHRLLEGPAGEPVLDDVWDTRAGISTFPASTGGLDPETTQGGVGLQIEWDVNDTLQIKSITSSRSDKTESWIDFDNLPADTFDAPVIYDNEQFSQELQLTYTGDRLAGVAGLYYLDANAFDAFDVIFVSSLTPFTLGDYDTDAWAAFFDFSYALNDQWNLSIGGRYTEDERTARVVRETFAGLGSPYFGNDAAISLTVPSEGVPEFNGKRTDSEFTPRVSLGYAPSDEHNLYLSYSEGFKGGGFDPRGAYNFAEVRQGFAPESVESLEFGAKSVWAGGRLTTNIAVFTMDYTDVQIPGSFVFDSDGDGQDDNFAGSVTNAGGADVDGFEFEAIARFTDNFSATFSLGLIDADYTEWLQATTDPVSGDPIFVDISSDREFQNTPETTASLNLRFDYPSEFGDIALLTGIAYRSSTTQFEIPNPLTNQGNFTLVDFSAIWTSVDEKYELGLYARNLFDEEYIAAAYDFPTVASSVIGFYGPPRTMTLSGTVNFF